MKKLGKKGEEKWLSPMMFIAWLVIIVPIVIAVLYFYGTRGDIRGIEAEILANKILLCISNSGYLKPEVLQDDFNLSKECGLDEKIISVHGKFYLNISVSDESGKLAREEIIKGNKEYEAICNLPGDKLPRGTEKQIQLLGKDGEKYKIEILACSNQIGRVI